jgi:hypothetical protein
VKYSTKDADPEKFAVPSMIQYTTKKWETTSALPLVPDPTIVGVSGVIKKYK